MNKKKKKQKWLLFGLCFLIAFLFLMICTKSSFLYAFNHWMDANCYFTIGKGMLHGKLYYVDLFDQKGPLLYFYHTIAALISEKSFIGVFFIEVTSFSFFLYYAYQTLHLYLKKELSFFALPLISFFILTLPAFSHGDSAEEFCLPFLMFSIYSLLKFFHSNQKTPNYNMIFINGLMAGFVFTIKFSMLGFWFGFMASLFFYMIYQKETKKAFKSCFVFLGGMILPILPWIIFFAWNHALDIFLDSYIYFNIHYYPSSTPLLLKILNVMIKPVRFFAQNPGIGIPMLIGLMAILFDHTILKKKEHKIILFSTFFFLCLGIFSGGVSFRYYYLILTPFIIFGFILFGIMIQKMYPKLLNKNADAIFIIMTTVILGFTFYGSKNTALLKPLVPKEELVQYKFAEIIKKEKNPTLLNYKFLDGGFYLAADILPSNRYFQKLNIPDNVYPDNIQDQNQVLKEKRVEFVVTRTKIDRYASSDYSKYLKRNYHEVSRMNATYEEHRYRYTLWQKNKSI